MKHNHSLDIRLTTRKSHSAAYSHELLFYNSLPRGRGHYNRKLYNQRLSTLHIRYKVYAHKPSNRVLLVTLEVCIGWSIVLQEHDCRVVWICVLIFVALRRTKSYYHTDVWIWILVCIYDNIKFNITWVKDNTKTKSDKSKVVSLPRKSGSFRKTEKVSKQYHKTILLSVLKGICWNANRDNFVLMETLETFLL